MSGYAIQTSQLMRDFGAIRAAVLILWAMALFRRARLIISGS